MDMKKWRSEQFGTGPKKSMPVLSFPCITLMDISVKELVSDADTQAKGMKMVADRCPTAASVSMMDLSVEAEAFGATISVPDDEVPTVVGSLIESEEDVDKLAVPSVDAGRTGRYVQAIAKAKGLITDRPVLAGVIGPFSLAGRLMDMSEIMVNCYDEPEMVHKTLEKTTEFITNYIREYKRVGADGIVMAEPAAGLLSPDLFEEFSTVYVKRIVDAVKADDFGFVYHNCGNTIPLKDSMLSIGADGYHLGNAIDIEEMLKIVPDDVLIMGNLDPSGVFRLSTPDQVRTETLALLERCSKHPNWAISSGCDIPPLSPWANIDAFFAAIDEYYSR
ncbi:MAG: uroporphyrinogen decarboxylase family protein [Planctomycetaceae bacterium]|nr:uroporphyrinogen decarboxylase family protein [Planctomycetaceae bacterium]